MLRGLIFMKKPELLAPAGSVEALYAAVHAGCDAVYLSGKKYGARSFANNFSDSEIIHAVKYCHLYGVKVYVTVNTIIYENEVDDFINYVDFLHSNNVDAIIMQDLGMIDLVRKMYPNLEVHISTQAHVHNLEGVKFFEELGVKRVVLARETSIDDIKRIRQNCDVDIEVFVHGALCISYSGQCLMSSLIGGRSGNRGACAGCCRLPYDLVVDDKVINRDKYLLSTRDLMTLDHVGELVHAGIDSFKIEGRMKRPEYVYLVVSLYRKAIDSYFELGYVDINSFDIKEMKKLFNREFTSGFLFNEKYIVNQKRPNHIGIEIGKVIDYKKGKVFIKLSDDLNINDGIRIVGVRDVGQIITRMSVNGVSVKSGHSGDIVSFFCDDVRKNSIVLKTTDYEQLNNINNKIKECVRKVSISGLIRLNEGKPLYFELFDGKNRVSYSMGMVECAKKVPISRDQIIKQISRLGDTVFSLDKIDVIMDDFIFVPVSILNDLRRKTVELLINERLYDTNYKKCDYSIELPCFDLKKEYSVLDGFGDYNYIYTSDYSKVNDNVYYKVPRVNYSYKNIESRVLVGEVGSLYKYKVFDTDFSFNVVNSYTVAFLHSIGALKVTLSYELDLIQTKEILDAYHKRYNKHPNLEVIVSSREEVMVSKFNLLDYYGVSSGCLRDRFGNLYPIKVDDNLMYVFNYRKRELNSDDYFNIGINVVRINM